MLLTPTRPVEIPSYAKMLCVVPHFLSPTIPLFLIPLLENYKLTKSGIVFVPHKISPTFWITSDHPSGGICVIFRVFSSLTVKGEWCDTVNGVPSYLPLCALTVLVSLHSLHGSDMIQLMVSCLLTSSMWCDLYPTKTVYRHTRNTSSLPNNIRGHKISLRLNDQ